MMCWICGSPPLSAMRSSTRFVAAALPSSALNWVWVNPQPTSGFAAPVVGAGVPCTLSPSREVPSVLAPLPGSVLSRVTTRARAATPTPSSAVSRHRRAPEFHPCRPIEGNGNRGDGHGGRFLR